MTVSIRPFGVTSAGEQVNSYLLANGNDMRVELLSYGAAIRAIELPDGNGGYVDVSLGYDDVAGYEQDVCYFGASIGRVANRIRDGRFTLGGKQYALEQNNNGHHLHGGSKGFHKRVWAGKPLHDGVIFTYYSPDGEEGYPGGLLVSARYTLSGNNMLTISYRALAEQDTLCNLTNHCYFNLLGHQSGGIQTQTLQLNAPFYTPNDRHCVPTGEVRCVSGTPMDFRQAKPLGQNLFDAFDQVAFFGGYDTNFALDKSGGAFCEAACVEEPVSGRRMRIYTDMPGIQLYTANDTNALGKGGAHYGVHSAFCLETQLFPDGINIPHFRSPELKAGQSFCNTTSYQFGW